MEFLDIFRTYRDTHDMQEDAGQQRSAEMLDMLYGRLSCENGVRGAWKRWLSKSPKGVYLWGSVGRGKTLLMDLFYASVPLKKKTRMHFHHFMRQIHHDLKHYSGYANPIAKVAKRFSKHYRLLCLDEFYVSDIADAMILSGILTSFFARGIVVVTTSNSEPQALYSNGLQRERFLPAIALIEHHMNVVHVDGMQDYRWQCLSTSRCYHFPLTQAAHAQLETLFKRLTLAPHSVTRTIVVNERKIEVVACADNVVWFTFQALCDGPRSSDDYIEIAQCYDTVMVSDVPQMGEKNESAAKRWMHLIDELYDRHVTLIVSAAVPIELLYQGTILKNTFSRTQSRLIEMQSLDYVTKPHG